MRSKLDVFFQEVMESVQLILKIVGAASLIILLLLILSFAATSPDETPVEENSTTVEVTGLNESVDRFTDPETGATCYVFNNSSISCVNEHGG